MSGYVKLWRGWRDNDIFRGEFSRADAWVWLIENAAWKETRARIKGDSVTLQRGELSFSQRFMAEKWGWSKSRVDRFIADLREEGMIETRAKIGATAGHNAGQGQSIITICNYAKYQDEADSARGNDTSKSGASAGQQRGKEIRREEGKKKERVVSDDTTRDLAEPKSRAQFDTETIVDDDTLSVSDVVISWNNLAREIGFPIVQKLTDARRTAVKARLRQYSIDDFVTVFAKIRGSPFLRGEVGQQGWKGARFDWTMNERNFLKIYEGNYDD